MNPSFYKGALPRLLARNYSTGVKLHVQLKLTPASNQLLIAILGVGSEVQMLATSLSDIPGDPLKGPRIKLQRADQHIDEIEREIASYFADDMYSLVIEKESMSGDKVAKIRVTKPIPDNLFLLVPEAIYHLRSTLDQLMVVIARSSGVTNVSHIYFPFGETAEQIERATMKVKGKKGKLFGLPSDVQEIVVALEPYKGGNTDLWALSRLSNVDKHGDLIPVGTVGRASLLNNLIVRHAKIGFLGTGSGNLEDGLTISILGDNGTITNRHGLAPAVAGPGSQADIEVTAQIAFGDVDVFNGEPIVPVLRHVSDLTQNIVEILASFCFSP